MPKAKTPTQVKLNRGSWRGKEELKTCPKRIVGDFACPADLKGEAKKFWNSQIEDLVKIGVISKPELPMFRTFCECWKDYRESMKNCPLDYHTHVKLRQELLKIAMQFGLTPATRANVRALESVDDKGDKERFFKIG